MNEREFYDYLQKNFTLDGTSSRLVQNIINFVCDGDHEYAEDAHRELWHLLDNTFGVTEEEVKLYRSDECEKPSLGQTLKENDAKSHTVFGNSASLTPEQIRVTGHERE